MATYAALALGALFLGIAGFGYLRLATGDRKPDKSMGSVPGTTEVSTASGDRYVFDRIDAHYQRNQEVGSIYILKGHVAETGGVPGKGRLLVHASLLDIENKLIAKKTVCAGVTVSEEELLYRDKAYIEQILSGNGTGEMKLSGISPSGSLPFMVVFFDVPNNIANYILTSDRTE